MSFIGKPDWTKRSRPRCRGEVGAGRHRWAAAVVRPALFRQSARARRPPAGRGRAAGFRIGLPGSACTDSSFGLKSPERTFRVGPSAGVHGRSHPRCSSCICARRSPFARAARARPGAAAIRRRRCGPPSGPCDGESFEDLRDLDDLTAPFLEVLDQYRQVLLDRLGADRQAGVQAAQVTCATCCGGRRRWPSGKDPMRWSTCRSSIRVAPQRGSGSAPWPEDRLE